VVAVEDIALEQATFEITQTHQALVHARHLVDEIHQTVRSASRYLDQTELDAAKAQLCEPDRRDRFAEAALDGLGHVSSRCRSGRDVSADLVVAVSEAGRHLDQATRLADSHPDAERYLRPQVDALRDLLAITEPIALAAFTHLNAAHEIASRATADGADRPAAAVQLHQKVIAVGHEVSRADEDLRLADVAVDRVNGAASRTASLALEINDTARSRMAAEQQRFTGAGPAGGGYAPDR
jgi:hypothetical protein